MPPALLRCHESAILDHCDGWRVIREDGPSKVDTLTTLFTTLLIVVILPSLHEAIGMIEVLRVALGVILTALGTSTVRIDSVS